MKKQTVVLSWAAALLLLVVTCCVIFFVFSDGLGGSAKTKAVEVFSCISGDIEGYSVYDKTGGYTLEKEEEGWHLENGKSAKLNQSAVEKMVAAASKITASGTISRKELDNFDMSDVKTVSLEVDDSEDIKIKFLGTSNNLCAFRVSGDRKTYVMYLASRDILAPSLDSLRIVDVFPRLVKVDTLPEYYRYTDYDGSVTEIRLKTSTELANSKKNIYMMEKPYKREVDDDLFEQRVVVKIPAIKARSFVKNPSEDKSVYGLDKDSRAELSFKWEDKTETLYLGKSKNGGVFAMNKNSKDVLIINSALLEFLQIDPFFVLDSGILKSEPENIVGVKVVSGNESYDITANGKSQKPRRYFVNGKAASSDVFEGILASLSNMSFKNEIDVAPANTKDIQIIVTYDGAGTQNISLVKSGENSYAVFLNEKSEFVVDGKFVAELMEELKTAVSNPMRMD